MRSFVLRRLRGRDRHDGTRRSDSHVRRAAALTAAFSKLSSHLHSYGARCLRALAHAPGCHECQWWRRCGWRSSPSDTVVGEARVRGARLCAGGGSHLPRFVADQVLRGRPRAGAAPVCAVQRDCEFIAGGGEVRARARRGGRRARRADGCALSSSAGALRGPVRLPLFRLAVRQPLRGQRVAGGARAAAAAAACQRAHRRAFAVSPLRRAGAAAERAAGVVLRHGHHLQRRAADADVLCARHGGDVGL